MKTQTTQLSLFETKQVSGGLKLENHAQNDTPSLTPDWIERPYVFITQALKENGGRFNIID
ncbi:MAG: hypothetical protein ACJAVV_002430 [Alphaproteobacteria bacterium]|jgi:hypothetical protein